METKQHATKKPNVSTMKSKNQKIPRDKQQWKHNLTQSMGCSKSSFKREVHSNTGLPQETRKISNNLTYHLKELEKQQAKPKVSRRK